MNTSVQNLYFTSHMKYSDFSGATSVYTNWGSGPDPQATSRHLTGAWGSGQHWLSRKHANSWFIFTSLHRKLMKLVSQPALLNYQFHEPFWDFKIFHGDETKSFSWRATHSRLANIPMVRALSWHVGAPSSSFCYAWLLLSVLKFGQNSSIKSSGL